MSFKVGDPYTVYLPLGKPLESTKPGDLDALRYKNTNVFMRRYENGLVLINPTFAKTKSGEYDPGRIDIDLLDSDKKTSLTESRTYTVKLDRRYIDPLTGDYIEGEITMPPVTGKILLKEPSL